MLAVSDPSADMTATQTWAVLDADQLGDGWTGAPLAGSTQAASAGADLAQDRAYGGEQDTADSWPHSAPGARGESPAGEGANGPAGAWENGPAEAAWGNGVAETAQPPSPGSARQLPRRGRASRDAVGADATSYGQWPEPDEEPTGRFAAVAQTTGRNQADTKTGRNQADTKTTAAGHAAAARGDTGTRVSRAAARGRKPRKPPSRVRVWLLPVLMALAVGTLVTVAYLRFDKGPASNAQASAPPRKAAASSAPTASLGPWKHITTRSEDPVPLTLTELFPARFSSGGTIGARTIDEAGTNCPAAVLGAGLQSAVHKADCTQVMRASYITTDQKIMGTIGVLNLLDATSAERAGQATGASEFIDQLPAATGPTHNLTKGTGLEEAVYKGHYLILIWAEFTNLRSPTTAAEGAALKTFSDNLVSGTANISLTSRMVIGKSQTP